MSQLEAAWLRLSLKAVYSGLTAAWLHGLEVDPCDPIEVTVRSVMTLVRATLGSVHTTAFRMHTNHGSVHTTVGKRRRAPAHPEPFGQGERPIS